jgi:hypothetical protein
VGEDDVIGFDILALLGAVALVLTIISFLKKQFSVLAFAGMIFLIMGLFVFNGVRYQTGYSIVEVGNTTTVTNQYTAYGDTWFKNTFGFTFTLLGVGLVILTAFQYMQPGKVKVSDDEVDDE